MEIFCKIFSHSVLRQQTASKNSISFTVAILLFMKKIDCPLAKNYKKLNLKQPSLFFPIVEERKGFDRCNVAKSEDEILSSVVLPRAP